jgi:hypothetical protein
MVTDSFPHFTYSKQDDINDGKRWTAGYDAELINEVKCGSTLREAGRTPLPFRLSLRRWRAGQEAWLEVAPCSVRTIDCAPWGPKQGPRQTANL